MKKGLPFLFALVAGVLSLAVLGGEHRYTALTGVLVAMGVYFIWILWTQRATKSYEMYADSFYYLGFMLTLAALLTALLSSDPQRIDLKDVVNRFGLGLITTLVGLSGRIALLEFAGGLEATAEDALKLVRHSAEQFAYELQLSARSIHEAHDVLSSTAKAHQEDMRSTLSASAQAVNTELAALVSSLQVCKKELSSATTELKIHLADVVRQTITQAGDAARTAMEETLNASRKAASGLTGAVDKINREMAKLTIPPGAQKLGSDLAELGAAIQAVKFRTEQAGDALAETERLGALIKQVASRVNEVGIGIDTFRSMIEQLSHNISKDMVGMSAVLQKQLTDQVDALAKLRGALESEVERSAAAVTKVHSSLVESVDFITNRLGP